MSIAEPIWVASRVVASCMAVRICSWIAVIIWVMALFRAAWIELLSVWTMVEVTEAATCRPIAVTSSSRTASLIRPTSGSAPRDATRFCVSRAESMTWSEPRVSAMVFWTSGWAR